MVSKQLCDVFGSLWITHVNCMNNTCLAVDEGLPGLLKQGMTLMQSTCASLKLGNSD